MEERDIVPCPDRVRVDVMEQDVLKIMGEAIAYELPRSNLNYRMHLAELMVNMLRVAGYKVVPSDYKSMADTMRDACDELTRTAQEDGGYDRVRPVGQ